MFAADIPRSGRRDFDGWVDAFRSQDRTALARLITFVENHPGRAKAIFERLGPEELARESYIIGITGSPGAGKSTLVNLLARGIVDEGKTVGVLSIDPSSPFTGGAFLGDRVRMNQLSGVPAVFVRSIATRGATGGLARAAFDICRLYEAFGKDVVIVESCGAGQTDYDFVKLAYTIILVSVPGMGDFIQVQKAGIMEIGDIHVVNKMDRGGEEIALQIDLMLDTDLSSERSWRPPVLKTNGITGEGVDRLLEAVWRHRSHMVSRGELALRKERIARDKILELVKLGTLDHMLGTAIGQAELDELTAKVSRRQETIYSASERLLGRLFANARS
ncbi:MAG: methylmalonyl Co-A mutase-associated GTPase MeaB [Acidobacteriota bacterium]